jgi:hypothetical protein
MASTETTQRVLSIPQEAREGDGDRVFVGVRRALDIASFGANAIYQPKAGEELVNEHDERGPGANGQEELYVLVQGSATFTVDGQEIDTPHGTALLVAPDSKRSAVTTSDETIVLVVGGVPGEAYRLPPGAELHDFFEHYKKEEWEEALAACHKASEKYPGNPLFAYNVACMESKLGRNDDALATLRTAIEGHPKFKENARADEDFAAIRDDPRFVELIS